VDVDYTFTFTNGTAGGADYTTTNRNRTCGCYYGNVSVPTTADTIDESNETFTIASGTASATGTINDNDNAPTERSLLLRLLKDPAVFQLYTKRNFCRRRLYLYIHQWNCWC
jgi:hypothetical protein